MTVQQTRLTHGNGGPGKDKKKKKGSKSTSVADSNQAQQDALATSPQTTTEVGKAGKTVTVANDEWGKAVITGQDGVSWTGPETDGRTNSVSSDASKGTTTVSQAVKTGDLTTTTSGTVGNNGDVTVGRSAKNEDGVGASTSATVNTNKVAVSHAKKTAAGASQASSFELTDTSVKASRYVDDGKNKNGARFNVNEDGFQAGAMMDNNGVTFGKDGNTHNVGVEAWRGQQTHSGSVAYNSETEEATFAYGVSNPKKKTAKTASVTVGDGKLSADAGYASKVAKASAGFTYIDKDTDGIIESPLVGGPAYSADNQSSFGVRGSAQYGVGIKGSHESGDQVRVVQALGPDGTLSEAQGNGVRGLRDHVADGGRYDVTRMPVGMGVERLSTSDSSVGAMADVAVVGADASVGWTTQHSQGLARTETGYVVMDALQHGDSLDAQANAAVWGMELVGGQHAESSDRRQALTFELDACDPAAVDYAQDYADLGLLPNWDLALDDGGGSEQVQQLRSVLLAIRNGQVQYSTARAGATPLVAEANRAVRQRMSQAGAEGACGVSATTVDVGDQWAQDSEWSLLGIYMGGLEGQTDDRRSRRTDDAGRRYLDADWSSHDDRGSRTGHASGAANAPSALSAEALHGNGTGARVDLSAESVNVLGQQLQNGTDAEAMWASMAFDARAYWDIVRMHNQASAAVEHDPTAPVRDQIPADLLPMNVAQAWVDAPLPADRLIEVFGTVTGPETFAALPAPLQASFVQSVAAVRESGALDALAAVVLMKDGEARGAALAGVAHTLAVSPEQAQAQLRGTSAGLSKAAAFALELAAQGVAVDVAAFDACSGPAWGKAVGDLLADAGASHDRAKLLLKVLQTGKSLGGAALVAGMVDTVGAATVARVFAAKSGWSEGSRLMVFVKDVLAGHPEQAAIEKEWADIAYAHNADIHSRETTGRGYFETPLDGPSLGGAGLSANDKAVMEAKMADFTASGGFVVDPAMAAAEKDRVVASANLGASGAIQDALDARDPAALIAALQRYRDLAFPYAAECLGDWAWAHRAQVGHHMAWVRTVASADQKQQLANLVKDCTTWDIAEKTGGSMELPKKDPMLRAWGF